MISLFKVIVLTISFFLVFLTKNSDSFNILELTETIENDFHREFNKYVQTGVISSELHSIYNVLKFPNELRYNELSDLPEQAGVSNNLCSTYIKCF